MGEVKELDIELSVDVRNNDVTVLWLDAPVNHSNITLLNRANSKSSFSLNSPLIIFISLIVLLVQR